MVGFLLDFSTDDEQVQDQASKPKNSGSPIEPSLLQTEEVLPSYFADSFLDFDSINQWIEDFPDSSSRANLESSAAPTAERLAQMADGNKAKAPTEGSLQDPFPMLSGAADCEAKIAETCAAVNMDCQVEKVDDGKDGSFQASCEGSVAGKLGGIESTVEPPKSDELEKVNLIGALDNMVFHEQNVVKRNKELDGNDEAAGESDDSGSSSESSPSASSSSSSSDDEDEGSSGDDSEDDNKTCAGEIEEGEILDSDDEAMVAWTESGDAVDDEDDHKSRPYWLKNVLQPLPAVPPVDETLQLHHQTLPVGVVLSIMGPQVIVEGMEKHNPLSEGSILWITETRSPLGLIDEIFGPVKSPYYKVRYNSEKDIPGGIHEGTKVSFVEEFASHVLNDSNIYKKGYDASGENDEEIGDEIEFSDDEKEAEYKRMLKMTKRGNDDQRTGKRKTNRKFRDRDTSRKDNHSASQAMVSTDHIPPPRTNQNQHQTAVSLASIDHGNCSFPPAALNFQVPPFPQVMQPSSFTMLPCGNWTNGLPYQQQPGMMFPNGPQAYGMVWPHHNYQQHLQQMPFPNGVPFQQQLGQNPANVLPQYGTSRQGAFSPAPLGMGLLGQHAFPPIQVGEQASLPNKSSNDHSQPPASNLGGVQVAQRGTKPPHRGGGRFRGRRDFQRGRGRWQSN